MNNKTTQHLFRLITGFTILLVLSYAAYFLNAHPFEELVAKLCDKLFKPELGPELLDSDLAYYVHLSLRFVLPLLTVLWCLRMYKVITIRRPLFGNWDDSLFAAISESLQQNAAYIKALPKYVKYALAIIFILQSGFLAYLVTSFPYHYDEAYSYLYFSGKGFISSLAYYPVPNNHVFYNIVSSQLLRLPISAVTGIRLISMISGLVSTYYFFKLAMKRLQPSIAACTGALYSFTYPILLYSMQGRGYGLMILFALLCMYSFVSITEGKSMVKYLNLYIVSGILGFFTIPSFLYCYVPLTLLLFLHFVVRFRVKDMLRFAWSQLVVGAVTVILYLPLIARNGIHALTENNGVVKRDAAYINENIKGHLEETWRVFTGGSGLDIAWVYMLAGFAVIHAIKKGYANRFYCLFVLLMILSPVAIIHIHKTIPFPRTWTYLVAPLCLGIGLTLNVLYDAFNLLFQKVAGKRLALPAVSIVLVTAICCVMGVRFYKWHTENSPVDIAAAKYADMLHNKLTTISTVAITQNDLSFYLAEDLNFELAQQVKDRRFNFSLVGANETPATDMVVLDKRAWKPVNVEGYDIVPYDNPYFIVYLRKGL